MQDIFSVDDVKRRYGCERHLAADIIRKLPSFKVGRRLFVKASDLSDWENSRIEYPVQPAKRGIPRRK